MISDTTNLNLSNPDFSMLLTDDNALGLLKGLLALEKNKLTHTNLVISTSSSHHYLNLTDFNYLKQQWQQLAAKHNLNDTSNKTSKEKDCNESLITDWLITLFNALFNRQQVILVRGGHEPEYFPAQDNQPARIEFAHGFFASALHELSHWCVAGSERRQQTDFGYWYAPDGRSSAQQQAFERVEIKPQALECLFTLACKRPFRVSQDNLFADFDTSGSTFAHDVYQQAASYITAPQTLPGDAAILLQTLLSICFFNNQN